MISSDGILFVTMARELCAEEYKREHQALLNLSQRLRDNGIDAQAILLKGSAERLLLEQAKELDADAVINVRFMTTSVIGSAAELLAYGTAVKLGESSTP